MSSSNFSSAWINLSATVSSSPVQRTIFHARSWTTSRIIASLSAIAARAHCSAPSSTGTCLRSAIAADSARPASGASSMLRTCWTSIPRTMPPSRSWSSACSTSTASRDTPRVRRARLPSPPPLGCASQPPAAAATSIRCIRRATTCGIRKLLRRNCASWSPIRSLLRGMIAVCGIGSPSGWRNSAVTANQSASPPTIAASANARTKPSHGRPGSRWRAVRNTAAIATSMKVAIRRIITSPAGGGSFPLRSVIAGDNARAARSFNRSFGRRAALRPIAAWVRPAPAWPPDRSQSHPRRRGDR